MSDLDQIVKGAPPPGKEYNVQNTTPIIRPEETLPSNVQDPLASLPSSPPQIYLNLLILEASLRAQWLQLRIRRRQHSFFLGLLGLWNIYFGYALFLAPREDGSGVGGSVYWVVEATERVCFLGGIVTGLLVWATGTWERGVRWPRRWMYTTNRGLRGFNCKLVAIKESWWIEKMSLLRFLFSYGLFSNNSGGSYRYVDPQMMMETEKAQRGGGHHALPNIHEDDDITGQEEDLAPGGDHVKLLLLPKPFSPSFRENWDIYRTEYWEKENERRALLLKSYNAREKKIAKQQGGWLWWTGYRGGWKRSQTSDIERSHHKHSLSEKDQKRVRSGTVRSGSHSRNSSRSTTPTFEVEEGNVGHVRRGSTASNSERRRKKTSSAGRKVATTGSRSATPEVPSPLVRQNSFTSISSLDSERSETPAVGDGDSTRSLKVSRGNSPSRKSESIRATKQT